MEETEWRKRGEGHRQRLRDKFLERGIDAFTDQEVLELLLVMGTPRKDCKLTARELYDRFGSLPAALKASQPELKQVKGIGPNNSFAIHFIHAVARRYLKQRLENKNYLRSSKEVGDYLIHSMRDLKREVFTVIFLDASHAIITTEIAAEGTITANTIYPREIIKQALAHNAAALVIAHNHPSGNPAPSAEDHKLTRNLYLACTYMNIRLLDHLIIAATETPYSFADHGIMASIGEECRKIMGS